MSLTVPCDGFVLFAWTLGTRYPWYLKEDYLACKH